MIRETEARVETEDSCRVQRHASLLHCCQRLLWTHTGHLHYSDLLQLKKSSHFEILRPNLLCFGDPLPNYLHETSSTIQNYGIQFVVPSIFSLFISLLSLKSCTSSIYFLVCCHKHFCHLSVSLPLCPAKHHRWLNTSFSLDFWLCAHEIHLKTMAQWSREVVLWLMIASFNCLNQVWQYSCVSQVSYFSYFLKLVF